MGYPNLYSRYRRVKGTKFFVLRDILSLATLGVGILIGIGLWNTPSRKRFAKLLEEGYFDDSEEMKRRRFLLHTAFTPKSSQQIREEIEEDRLFTNVLGRGKESMG